MSTLLLTNNDEFLNCFLCLKILENDENIPIYKKLEPDGEQIIDVFKIIEKALSSCNLKENSMTSKVICKTCNSLIIQYENTVKKAFQLLNQIKEIYLENNQQFKITVKNEDNIETNETLNKSRNSPVFFNEYHQNNQQQRNISESLCEEKFTRHDELAVATSLIDATINAENNFDNDVPVDCNISTDDDSTTNDPQKKSITLKCTINKALTRNTGKKVVKRRQNNRSMKSADVDEKINKFMKLICHLCSKNLDNFAELRNHFREEHNRSGYAFCCNTKIYKRCRLSDHIDTHLNPETFKCEICSKTFNTREYLQLHITNLHTELNVSHQCDQCSKKFAWKSMLDAHKYIHTPKETWTIKCEECGKTFATKYFLASHKHSVHRAKDKLKICHICGKNISNKMFKRHQKTHMEGDEPKVQCEICGSWLKHQRYLKIHLANHEESMVDHICTTCGKNSPNRRALAKHIRDTHTESRIHKCHVCEKSFKRRHLLTQHITTHTGELLYKCPYCDKSFTYDSAFYVHKKKTHPIQLEEEKLKRRGNTSIIKDKK